MKKLEASPKECTRNVEVMWLMNKHVPDHRCICNFRKDNKTAIKKAFCEFVKLCDALGLLGKGMVTIDGSKFRASNTRKKNSTIKKCNKKIEHFQKMLAEYEKELDINDEKIINTQNKINENKQVINELT